MRKKALMVGLLALLFGAVRVMGLALKFSPAGGAVWAAGDQISESEIGFYAGGTAELELWKGFDYGFRYYYSIVTARVPNNFNPDTTIGSYHVDFAHHAFSLTNTWSPGWRYLDPYIRGGAGLYLWKGLCEDTLVRVQIPDPQSGEIIAEEELKGTSFGLSLGAGIHIWPFQLVGVRLGLDYDLIFSEDIQRFGTEDANENLLRIGAELIFRLPLR